MKKICLLLMSLLCLPSFAQLQKSIVYDFNHPKQLTPSITPSVDNAGIVNVTKNVFTNGPVSISFEAGGQPVGAQIFTFIDAYNSQTTYSLRITFTTTMTVSIGGGAVLDSIRISKESSIGALHLDTDQPGELDPYQMYKFWKSNTKTCTAVRFKCGDSPALIQQMTVYYTTPSAVLTPTETSIANNATVESFNAIALTFGSAMQLKSGSNILLTNQADNSTKTLTASCNGNVVTLTAPAAINEDGDYTITVPAGCFVNSEGYENKELTYNFKVYVPRNTFNDYAVEPEPGKANSLNDTIFITYQDVVKLDNELKDVVLNKDGKPLYQLALSVSKDKKTVYLTHEHGDITDNGTYMVTIPEKTIHNDFLGNAALDRYNAKIDLQWSVDNTPIDTETMKAAKALLANTDYQGLGYPATNSDSRKNLQALTEAATVPTDEVLTAAINAFYDEQNVTLPTANHYYKVIGTNANGDKLYLAYQNGSIVLTTTAKEGAPFLLNIVSGNTVTLQTRDGKYLHVLTAKPATGTALPNVTDTYNAAINNLTLAKLKVADVANTSTFGLFSLSGASINTSNVMYSQLNYKDNAIASQEGGALTFGADNSCAFLLEETDQYADVAVTETACTLSPTQVENNGEKLTLSFTDVKVLTLENATAPYIANSTGAKVSTSVSQLLTAVSGSTSSFSVNLSGLADGTYTLVIPQYTLFYTEDGKVKTTAEIKKSFTIKAEPKFQYVFDSYAFLQDVGVDTPVTDESLNEFVVFVQVGIQATGIHADESKTVRLAYYDDNTTIRTGHFVDYSSADFAKDFKKYYPNETVPGNVQAIKLVFDSPIKLGELKPGRYSYVIEAGTFGDENFGKYLKGDKTVAADQCKVNRKIVLSQLVNNDAAIPKYPSAEVLAAAKELLKKSGLGYPTATSSARTALQTLVNSGMGDDAQYTAAMEAFASTTSVEMPAAGKYYTIAGVTSNNKVAYLQYDGTNVTLTTDAAKATGFKAIAANTAYNFQTGDGKYLHTLMNGDGYTGTSKSNVTSTLDASVNNLLVVRLGSISDVDAEKTMGLFSIYGSMGKDSNGAAKSGYSLVNASTAAIQAPSASLTSFSETLTNGFRFAEIDKAKIPVPAAKYTLSPADKAEQLSLKQVTLTFSYPGEVTVADKSKVTLKDAAGKTVTITDVALASGSKNKVNITFSELAAGTYTLSAAKGAFTYTFADTKQEVAAITATYTVPAKPEVKYTLSPAAGAKLEELSAVTLTFTNPTSTTLKDATKITLTDANKKAVAVQVKAVDGKQGAFTISFSKLAPGTYTLTAAKGAFAYTLAGTSIEIDAVTATYSVEEAADIQWALSPEPGDQETLNSIVLTFTSNKDITLADKSKVTLKNAVGMAITLKDIVKDGNEFTLSFDKLGSGVYTLEAAQGAFTYKFVDKTLQVDAITAKYTVLARPEVAVAISPAAGSSHEVLSSVTLTFTGTDKPITVADASKITLKNAVGVAIELKEIVKDGNKFTISFDELGSGVYTFEAAQGAFAYTFGGESVPVDGITATYTRVPNPTIEWAVSPDPTVPYETLNSVTLTFGRGRQITLADKSKVTLTDGNGQAVAVKDVTGSQNVFVISFDDLAPETTYTLTAASGAFTYQFGGRANPVDEITATYTVSLAHPSEEVLEMAKLLLQKTGVGYPTADSKARQALSQLVETNHGTDEDFQKAMDDFYAETDVEKPAVDKYYQLATATTYIKYVEGTVSLTENAAEATAFKLTAADDKTFLVTADGKQQYEINIDKFVAEDLESAFGLFGISGSLFAELQQQGFTFAEIDNAAIPVPQVGYAFTPENGAEMDVLTTVTVTLTGYDDVALADKSLVSLLAAGDAAQVIEPKGIEPVEGTANQYVVTFDVDEPGTYTLNIAKGAFNFVYADLTHQVDAATAQYTVKVPRPSEETMAAAQELLKQTGVGYPAADSKARTALEALVELGEGKDEVFVAAMADFLAETDVEQPAVGKYYRIAAVNSKGAEGYVTYEDGSVDLTANADDATVGVFHVTALEDGSVTVNTFDSKYERSLTLARMTAEDVSAEATFGLFSIYGSLDGSGTAFARASIEDGVWSFMSNSILDKRIGLILDEDMTTAFRLVEVAEEDLVVPQVEIALNPEQGEVENLDVVKISLTSAAAVALQQDAQVSLKSEAGDVTAPLAVVPVEGTANTYEMTFINVVAGTYTLEIGEGAFAFNFFDKVIPVGAISQTFTVTVGADFAYDLATDGMDYYLTAADSLGFVLDSDLNNLAVRFEGKVCVNPDNTVLLVNAEGQEVAKGHFEAVEDENEEGSVFKLQLDSPIVEGTLPTGTYTFVFAAQTFGDENYAKYLAGQQSVLMSDCHVNPAFSYEAKVDNAYVTKIWQQKVASAVGKVYDLNGRRVNTPQKGRVYIVNGRKVAM